MEIFLFVTFGLYAIYMKVVQWKLNVKDGAKGWIALVPLAATMQDFTIAGRRKAGMVNIIAKTLSFLLLVLAMIVFTTEMRVIRGDIPGGTAYASELDHVVAVLLRLSFFSAVAALATRFSYGRGLCERFDIESRWDYPLGVVLFPFAFKGRLALFSRLRIGPVKPKKGRRTFREVMKALKDRIVHFF